jgi:hypothetical protein
MGLLDNLEPPTQQSKCSVSKIKETLSEPDQIKLEEMIADLKWSISALTKALNSKGIEISRYPLISHRNGSCSCSRI